MIARQTVRTATKLLGAAQGRRYVAELRSVASPTFSTAAAEAYNVSTPTPREGKAPTAYPLKMPEPARKSEPQEAEAQPKTQHIAPEQAATEGGKATTTNVEKPKRRPLRPLRPRKAAMKLSESAVRELKKLLDMPEPKLIKVGVKQKGCSGLTYDLSYVDKPGMMDEVVEQDGVKIVIDSRALMSVIGSEMHWEEDLLSRRFVFRNPNIKQACGCGESFMV